MVPVEEEGEEEMSEKENPCAEEKPFAVKVIEEEIAELEDLRGRLEVQIDVLRHVLDKATQPQPRSLLGREGL